MTKNNEKSKVHTNQIKHRSVYEKIKDFGLPVIVLVIGLFVTISQHQIEEKRIERQENIERERNQISILNNYRRSISNLIGTTNLKNIRRDAKEKKNNYFHPVSTALTKSTLPQLDGIKKGNLITYLITLDLVRLEMSNGYAPITLAGTNLSDANLRNLDLRNVDLRNSNLYGAILVRANLSEANLNNANLLNANLNRAYLRNANLRIANLSNADLSGANLSRTDLGGAILNNSDLNSANLNNSDLSGADLIRANLSNANLSSADFGGADLSGADLRGADLRSAKGIIPLQLLKAKNWKDALLVNFIREATLKAEIDKETKSTVEI